MNSFLFPALVIAMLATLATLIIGIVAMVRGGPFNEKYGNKLMRLRVVLQGVALVIFAFAVMAGRS
jgi:ABC-type dipeptide/oligopeptide/nickel transport system permease subunit